MQTGHIAVSSGVSDAASGRGYELTVNNASDCRINGRTTLVWVAVRVKGPI